MGGFAMHLGFQRRALLAAALHGAAAAAGAQGRETPLPRINLMVEVRQSEDAHLQERETELASGSVSVHSDGRLSGRAGVSVRAGAGQQAGALVQQVRVLNGGRATVRLTQAVALQWLQLVWTPQGVQAVPGTQWAEAVRGFVVKPAWPGGNQPVTVEISAEQGRLPAGTGAAGAETASSSVLTTVQLPLNEWYEVARSSDAARSSEHGVLSSRDAQRQRGSRIELRVTAP